MRARRDHDLPGGRCFPFSIVAPYGEFRHEIARNIAMPDGVATIRAFIDTRLERTYLHMNSLIARAARDDVPRQGAAPNDPFLGVCFGQKPEHLVSAIVAKDSNDAARTILIRNNGVFRHCRIVA